MSEQILLPCPFCGGNAEIKQYAANGIQVRCKSCLMGLKQKTLRCSLEWLTDRMVESWNARKPTNNQPPKQEK